ncbi:MAG: DUF3025 domain-containing protein [Betaproteobacteria bacterium]|nr:DUF3025 domain-containing protein [Betaproteobacteria bacterium]
MADIDWQVPWLAGWRALGEAVAQRVVLGTPQPQALNAAGRAPVRFVPQADLPVGMAYEAFIGETGQVPTREGLHDFFNALCWMHFPLAKRQLNRLQTLEIARDGVQAVRGPVRDACTLFDENALLIQAPEAVWQALADHRWPDALVRQRSAWAQVRIWVFGHALLEKLVQPYKSITAHLWRVPEGVQDAALDAWLAQDLCPNKLATKPFSPLPVLGVPGWWAANAEPGFYDDAEVFRPRRARVQKPRQSSEIPAAA